MDFTTNGIVLSVRRHGETSAIVHVLTPDKGLHAGLVHGGVGRKMRPVLQAGNIVACTWRARLSEHLGTFTIEPISARAAQLMDERLSLSALNAACAITLAVMPEREPHQDVYDAFEIMLSHMDNPDIWPALYVRWEMGLLAAMGYGLDLSRCAVSGRNDALTHVSPRTGRAVSASEAEPYLDKLLALPQFLRAPGAIMMGGDVEAGLKLTGHFIQSRILWPSNKQLPQARERMIARLGAEGRL
ncbi:MAG: DNA repair protein RecO [Robiginitomaculum sp.]